jgi:hypothetical protein
MIDIYNWKVFKLFLLKDDFHHQTSSVFTFSTIFYIFQSSLETINLNVDITLEFLLHHSGRIIFLILFYNAYLMPTIEFKQALNGIKRKDMLHLLNLQWYSRMKAYEFLRKEAGLSSVK